MIDKINLEKLINHFVDPETGIIQEIIDVPIENGLPGIYRSIAIRKSLYCWKNKPIFPESHGYGYSFSRIKARMRALGEAIERYSGSFQTESDFFTCVNDLRQNQGSAMLDPMEFWHYPKNRQTCLTFPSSNKKYHWSTAYCAYTLKKMIIPESLIYFQYKNRDELLTEDDTCGLACGASMEDAILSGLLECLERDAFGVYWLLNLSPASIELKKIDSEIIKHILYELEEYELSANLYLLEMDHKIPCFALIIGNDSNPRLPKQYIALRAGAMNPELILHLIEEALGGYNSLARIYYERTEYPKTEKEITTLEDHALYFGKSEFSIVGDHWPVLNQVDPRQLSLPSECAMKDALNRLKQVGIRVFFKNITSKDIQQSGLNVVRVISPDLYRLHHLYPKTKSPRIEKMMKYLKLNRSGELNLRPHPFS